MLYDGEKKKKGLTLASHAGSIAKGEAWFWWCIQLQRRNWFEIHTPKVSKGWTVNIKLIYDVGVFRSMIIVVF